MQEVISDVRDRAGLYIEIKHYEFYKSLGYDVIDKLKQMIRSAADVETFHSAGLLVHPYTFRGPTTAVNRCPLGEAQAGGLTLRQLILADIDSYLTFGVDGGFTDYTDLWAQAAKARAGRIR